MIVKLKREDLLRMIFGSVPDLCYRDSGLFMEDYYDFREYGGGWIKSRIYEMSDEALHTFYISFKKEEP